MGVVVLDRSLGAVGVGRGERGADVLEADAVMEDRRRVDLDAHGRQRRPRDVDLANSRKLGQALLEDVRGDIVELARCVPRGGHCNDHDRRVRRIDLVVGWVLAQACRQVGARGDDRRLDVARRAVDVAVEAELQGDVCRAEGALRRHFVDVGDLAEMALERRGDRLRHGVGARARHVGLNGDDRKIDLRQRRDGQLRIAEQTREDDADRQQRRGDRPADEDLGEAIVHDDSAASVASAAPRPNRSPSFSKKR